MSGRRESKTTHKTESRLPADKPDKDIELR